MLQSGHDPFHIPRGQLLWPSVMESKLEVAFWGLWSSLAVLTWHRDCTVRAGGPRPRRLRSDPV